MRVGLTCSPHNSKWFGRGNVVRRCNERRDTVTTIHQLMMMVLIIVQVPVAAAAVELLSIRHHVPV